MHKSLFFVFALSLCMADFGAFAANTRGGRTSAPAANNASAAAPVAARAGARQTVKASPTAAAAQPSAAVSGNTAARAGKKQTVANIGVKTTTPAAASPMAARAGKTQKVVSNSTKVTEATTNTAVSQECQNWFFGCMDSFCMVDNVNGARCQCSDRNAELQTVMEEIAKIDEESYILATEGVERIKMGEKADAVIAAAKAAGDKATGKATDTSIGTNIKASKKSYQLDLSAWKSNVFAEDDDDDVFETLGATVDTSVINDALAKKGNELYTYSATMCLKSNMPDACKDHTKILQSMYAQKIRSDCAAFENKLKQDKVASSEKLRTAQNALRSAALESYEDKNKYNLGGCVQEYSKCMKNECGSDYSKCMLLAAEENMKGGAGNAKSRTIKGVVDIVLAGSTMTQLLAKKTICDDEVLVHCENYRAQVWDRYIEGAATEIHAAELAAEDDMRQNCIKTTAECFKNSCAASWDPKKDSTNYDLCLADPMMVYDSCKIKIEPCLVATGSKNTKTKAGLEQSRLWTGVTSMLAALRVDACTEELKAAIEANCGSDFTHCVGLSTDAIVDLVAEAKLTACQDRYSNNDQSVREYISQIAQGYALQVDSTIANACQKAASAVMLRMCGSEDSCEALDLGNISFTTFLDPQLCVEDDDSNCSKSADAFKQDDIIYGRVRARLLNRVNINNVLYKETKENNQKVKKFTYDYTTIPSNKGFAAPAAGATTNENVESVLNGLNNLLASKKAEFLADRTVDACINGKTVQGISGTRGTENRTNVDVGSDIGRASERYPNLLDNYMDIMVNAAIQNVRDQYAKAEQSKDTELDALNEKVSTRLAGIEAVAAEKVQESNKKNCDAYAVADNIIDGFKTTQDSGFFQTGCVGKARDIAHYISSSNYDETTSVCTVTRKRYSCTKMLTGCCWRWDGEGVVERTREITMPKYNRERDVLGNKATDYTSN